MTFTRREASIICYDVFFQNLRVIKGRQFRDCGSRDRWHHCPLESSRPEIDNNYRMPRTLKQEFTQNLNFNRIKALDFGGFNRKPSPPGRCLGDALRSCSGDFQYSFVQTGETVTVLPTKQITGAVHAKELKVWSSCFHSSRISLYIQQRPSRTDYSNLVVFNPMRGTIVRNRHC